MSRDETIAAIHYSIRIERMMGCLQGRLNRAATFAQLFLSASVFADISQSWLIAVPLVALSVYTIVYEPGTKAVLALNQANRYNKLLGDAPRLDDADLQRQYAEIQVDDCTPLGAICNAALVGEYIRGGHRPPLTLSKYEKAVSWLAGDLPRAN